MSKKKGQMVGNAIGFMIAIFVLLVLAFTWFFPTINGSSAINNTTTLFIGGTNYSWVVPLLAVVVCIALVLMVLKKADIINL